jgi:hypothetical protein
MNVAMEKVEAAASAGETSLMNRLAEQRRVEIAAEVERQVETRLLAEREEAADAAVHAMMPSAKTRPPAGPQPRGSVAQATARGLEEFDTFFHEELAPYQALTVEEAVVLEEAARSHRDDPSWVTIDPVRFSPFPCGKPLLPTHPKVPPPLAMLGMTDAVEGVGSQVEEGKDVHGGRKAKAQDGGDWRVPRVPTPPPPPARRAKAMDLAGVPTPPVPVARPKVAVTHNQVQRARAKTDNVLKAKLDSYGDEKKRIKEARRSWLALNGPDVALPRALMPRMPDGRLAAVDMVTGASLNVPYEGPALLY